MRDRLLEEVTVGWDPPAVLWEVCYIAASLPPHPPGPTWGGIRVSKSHGLKVVQPGKMCLTLHKILRFAWVNKKNINYNLFYSFYLHVSRILSDFCNIFALFLAQNFKTKVLTAQQYLLLECLGGMRRLAYRGSEIPDI